MPVKVRQTGFINGIEEGAKQGSGATKRGCGRGKPPSQGREILENLCIKTAFASLLNANIMVHIVYVVTFPLLLLLLFFFFGGGGWFTRRSTWGHGPLCPPPPLSYASAVRALSHTHTHTHTHTQTHIHTNTHTHTHTHTYLHTHVDKRYLVRYYLVGYFLSTFYILCGLRLH